MQAFASAAVLRLYSADAQKVVLEGVSVGSAVNILLQYDPVVMNAMLNRLSTARKEAIIAAMG